MIISISLYVIYAYYFREFFETSLNMRSTVKFESFNTQNSLKIKRSASNKNSFISKTSFESIKLGVNFPGETIPESFVDKRIVGKVWSTHFENPSLQGMAYDVLFGIMKPFQWVYDINSEKKPKVPKGMRVNSPSIPRESITNMNINKTNSKTNDQDENQVSKFISSFDNGLFQANITNMFSTNNDNNVLLPSDNVTISDPNNTPLDDLHNTPHNNVDIDNISIPHIDLHNSQHTDLHKDQIATHTQSII